MESSGPVGAPPTPGGPSRSSANRPAEHPGDASAPPIVLLVEDDPDIAATIRTNERLLHDAALAHEGRIVAVGGDIAGV